MWSELLMRETSNEVNAAMKIKGAENEKMENRRPIFCIWEGGGYV